MLYNILDLKKIFTSLLFIAFLGSFSTIQADNTTPKDAEFNVGEMIMHHIADTHGWEFAHGVELPLPVILYTPDRGLEIFSSSKFHNDTQQYDRYLLHHNHIYIADEQNEIKKSINDTTIVEEKATENENLNTDEQGKILNVAPLDFSITKNVASMFVSVLMLFLVFINVRRGYIRNAGKAPSGVQSFFEPIIVFIRDDIAIPFIGAKKHNRYMPYLLTVFFFIWFNNMLGLLPGGANLTGNIAVTMVLALLTFAITMVSSNLNYWKHIFWMPGVPVPMKLFLAPIELVSMLSKPFSLMIRLFANITAGHIVILSLIGLIFVFKTVMVAPVSVAFALFINAIELFVALMQAYIFTLLSAMYFGGAVEEHDHDHASQIREPDAVDLH